MNANSHYARKFPAPPKTCAKCGTEKARMFFGRDKQQGDGLQCWCRSCKTIYRRTNNVVRL